MHPDIFTNVWAQAWCRELNASEAYKTAAATWEGAVALVMLPDPELGITAARAVQLDLHRGACRSAQPTSPDDLAGAAFVFEGAARTWRDLLAGRLSPLMALIGGKLRLSRGDLGALMPYVNAARELVATASVVHSHFPDPA
jgi:putative sterol carrier protein